MTSNPTSPSSREPAPGAGLGETELVAERDSLREQLDAMLNHEVSAWLGMERTQGAGIGDYQGTISWRVTKPLRLVRRFQYSARDIGFAETVRLAAKWAARRNGR